MLQHQIHLKLRDKSIDVSQVEELNGIKFPPIYKMFIQNFAVQLNIPRFGRKDNTGKMQVFNIAYPKSKKENYDILAFERFLEPDEIFKYKDVYFEWLNEYGIVPISQHSYNASLWVGIKPENVDNIYFAIMGTEKEYLDENIFDFLRNCRLNVNQFADGKLHNLKKNYTDEFWEEH